MPHELIELWLFGLAAAALLCGIACTLYRGSRGQGPGTSRRLSDAEMAAGVAALAGFVGLLN